MIETELNHLVKDEERRQPRESTLRGVPRRGGSREELIDVRYRGRELLAPHAAAAAADAAAAAADAAARAALARKEGGGKKEGKSSRCLPPRLAPRAAATQLGLHIRLGACLRTQKKTAVAQKKTAVAPRLAARATARGALARPASHRAARDGAREKQRKGVTAGGGGEGGGGGELLTVR